MKNIVYMLALVSFLFVSACSDNKGVGDGSLCSKCNDDSNCNGGLSCRGFYNKKGVYKRCAGLSTSSCRV